MKRALAAIGFFILAIAAGIPTTASANVQNFSFKQFTGDYYLSRDTEGRAQLRVVETLVAQFPEYDQNKGIVRAIPKIYDGHTVAITLESVQRNGSPEPIYSQYTENNNLVIETGTNAYVRGEQAYTFTYTLHDVTKDFGTHQEFYWNTNGTQFKQPFAVIVGRVHLDSTATNAYSGETLCYQGSQGSRDACAISSEGNVITFTSVGAMPAGHTVTMVMKFAAGTFQPYTLTAWEVVIRYVLPIIAIASSLGALIWTVVIRRTTGRSARGRGTIVPEYLPPRDVSVFMASGITGKSQSAIAAQFVDLAVRHNIRISEQEKPGLIGAKKVYVFTLLNTHGLHDDERQLLEATTGLSEGAQYEMKRNDTMVGNKMMSILQHSTTARLLDEGYKRKVKNVGGPAIMALISFGIALLVNGLSGDVRGAGIGIAVVGGFIAVFISVFATLNLRPLTEKGALLKDYLDGLKMYIRLAETERLRALQSPDGARKTSIDTNDTQQMVHLYERVLPYAIVFGLEKDWAKVLEVQYTTTGTQPDWYMGQAGFNAAVFASSLSGFTSTTSSSFASPTSSSGSGFGGGGFSGGGGGGGGGGGR